MKTVKLFKNGRSQAVRLPKGFRFEGIADRVGGGVFEARLVLGGDPVAQAEKPPPPPREVVRVAEHGEGWGVPADGE